MKSMKCLGVLISALSVFVCASPGSATTDQSQKQPDTSQPEKTVRIIIEQSGEGMNLPFEPVAHRLLEYTGLKVVAPESKDTDYTLKIEAKGKALGDHYKFGDFSAAYYYTGASLNGTISLELSSGTTHQIPFSGEIIPPYQIDRSQASPSPDGAPFDPVFRYSGSFISEIVKILGEVYGSQFLIEAIKDMDPDIRRAAARTSLEKLGNAAIEPLFTALKADDLDVRKTVATVLLEETNDPRAVEPLLIALKDENIAVRKIAVTALEKIQDPRVVEPLITALKDEYVDIRKIAVTALGETKDPRAVKPLIVTLKHWDTDVRVNAIKALEEMGTVAIELLITALKTEDIDGRKIIVEILKKITGQSFGEDYEVWFQWWQEHKE